MSIYGDPAANAPVYGKFAVLLGGLAASTPVHPAAFTLNTRSRTASVTTTSASTAITAATATFTAEDVGSAISGTGIPVGATITAVASGTSATISAAATASGTVTATIGTTTSNEWDVVGALDDDSPFDSGEESIEVTSHSAAGLGVYAKTYRNQEERVTFTALETTLITLGILYDASAVTDTSGTLAGKLKQRDPSETFKVAFQRENATTMERRISENYAQIDTITRSGAEKSLYTVTVSIYPTADQEIYDYYLGPKA